MRNALAALALIASPLALATDLGGDGLGGPSLQPRAQSAQLGEPGIANRELSQVDPVLIEAGEPALDFRFAKNKNLIESTTNKSSLITFSRSAAQSPGTYVGSDGLIHDAAVNLALYSEQFDNVAWVKSNATVKANQVVAPDGKQTADKIEENGATGVHRIDDTASVVTGGVYTLSVYFKAAERDRVLVRTFDGGANLSVACKSDGTIANIEGTPEASTNEDVGNGWKRCSMTYRIAGGTTGYMRIGPIDAGSSASYAGTDGNGIYLWGAQLEETDPATMQPTAYIHTTSQALAAPRFDHVPTTGNVTTNLLTYSEMFDQSAWSKTGVTVTANQDISPDGKQSAESFVESTSSATRHGSFRDFGAGGIVGTNTFSVFVKNLSGDRRVRLIIQSSSGATNFGFADFNLQTKTVSQSGDSGTASSTTGAIEDMGNGWLRVSVTSTATSGQYATIALVTTDSAPAGTDYGYQAYAADNTSGIYIYGAQLEASPTAGPYVRTLSKARSISDANAESLGLLVEEARANAYRHSQNFANATFWTTSSVTVSESSEYGPHGQFFEVGSSVANTEHIIYASSSNFTQTVGTWTETVFLKYDNWQHVFVGSNGSSSANWAGVIVDLVNGTITDTQSNGTFTLNSSSIENYGDTFRVRITITSVTDGHRGLRIRFSNSATPVYGGYGSINFSGDANDKILIGGAQAEAGSFPTSYIPTTGSSQTRYADVAAVQDEDFSTTNLLAYSESFDVGWAKSAIAVSENSATSPDGQTTADEIEATSAGINRGVYRGPISYSGSNTFCAYAKKSQANFLGLTTTSGPTDWAYFDLENGEVGSSNGVNASISDEGDGWYRACIYGTLSVTYAIATVHDQDYGTTTWGGGSANAGDSIYLWGASLTATEYPVEYVTTRNLIEDSQDFERSTWLTVASGAALPVVNNDFGQAPDGTNTADKIDFGDTSASTGNYSVIYNHTTNLQVGKIYRSSLYVKAATASDIGRKIYAYFEATVHEFTLTAEWRRIEYFNAASASAKNFTLGARGASSLQPAFSALVWGAQMEPVPDTVTTATDYVRTVDAVGKDYQWYEPTEGTVFVRGDTEPTRSGGFIGLGTGIGTIYKAGNNATEDAGWWNGSSFVGTSNTSSSWDVNANISASYSYLNRNICLDGGAVASSATENPIGDKIRIGQYYDGSNPLNGHIRRLTYWPRRQADSTLQVITQ